MKPNTLKLKQERGMAVLAMPLCVMRFSFAAQFGKGEGDYSAMSASIVSAARMPEPKARPTAVPST